MYIQRSPAERGRMKRAPVPQVNAGGFSLTAPTTITVIQTFSTPPEGTTESEAPSSTITLITDAPTSTRTFVTPPPETEDTDVPDDTTQDPPEPTTPSVIPRPSNSSTAPSGQTSAADSNALGTRSLPAGAVVGIVIGVVIVLLTAMFILVRKRFMNNRRNRRRSTSNWIGRPGGLSSGMKTIGSFEPAEKYPDTASVYPSTANVESGLSPGGAFAISQARAAAANTPRPPVPPLPPSSYNNIGAAAAAAISPRNQPTALPSNNATASVKFTFIPSLPDELSISNGEVVRVLQEYDDGWALCMNNREVQGMVPLECLDRGDGRSTGNDLRNSRRVSSLGINTTRR